MSGDGFASWRDGFAARAREAGASLAAVQHLLAADFLPEVIAKDQHQPEHSLPIWSYLDRVTTADRIAEGQAALDLHADTLRAISTRYETPAPVLAAIWGAETAYGTIRGDTPTLSALATLAFEGRRGALFEGELLAALRIIDTGEAPPAGLIGSWAGAMGHTQFMPSSWLARAVDFDGDGRRDIWSDDPTDALASTANFLLEAGWQAGEIWGAEVAVSDALASQSHRASRPASEWASLGVEVPDVLARSERLTLRLPAGRSGPGFLTGANFEALLSYNASVAYALAVAHLSDRIAGASAFARGWPRDAPRLSRGEVKALQEKLTSLGFDTRGADGLVGPDTQRAIAAFQKSAGLIPDGFLSAETIARLS